MRYFFFFLHCVLWILSTVGFAQDMGLAKRMLKPTTTLQTISLQAALDKALKENKDILVSKAQLLQQRTRLERAVGRYLPKLQLDANYTFNYPEVKASLGSKDQNTQQAVLFESVASLLQLTQNSNPNPDTAAAQITQLEQAAAELRHSKPLSFTIQPASTFGARLSLLQPLIDLVALSQIESSKLQTELGEKRFVFQANSILVAVAQSYLNALYTSRLIELAMAQENRIQKQLQTMQLKYKIGSVRRSDLNKVEIDFLNAKQYTLQTKDNHNFAMGILGSLIGIEETFLLDPAIPIKPIEEQETLDSLFTTAKAKRGDWSMQQLAFQIATQGKKEVYAGFWPSLYLNAYGQYQSNTSGFSSQPFGGALVLQASLNLYDGGDRFARLKDAKAQIYQERVKLKEMEQAVQAELRGKLQEIQTQKTAQQSSKTILELQRSTHLEFEIRFQQGMIETTELLDANQQLLQKEVDSLNAEVYLNKGRIELAFLCGDFAKALPTSTP